MSERKKLIFSKIIAGKYSNRKQSQNAPQSFAYINLYFLPISWGILKGPGFYSEQSYNHDPWSPYRQGLHKLEVKDNIYILKNYEIIDSERYAGAGFEPFIYKQLLGSISTPRKGCAMHFRKLKRGVYKGEVEPGSKCLLLKDESKSYLKSNVTISAKRWVSEDSGFDIESHKKIWGSENGPFIFDKINKYDQYIDLNWLYGAENL